MKKKSSLFHLLSLENNMHYANINAMNDTDFLCLLQKSLGINHSQKGLYVLTPENVTKTTAMRIVQLIKSGMKHGDISDLFAKHNILITADNIACVHCRGLKQLKTRKYTSSRALLQY